MASSMRRTAILVLCCLAQFVSLLDVAIVNVALPSIGSEFGTSTTGLQWVVNAYTLALAGFLLLGGRAADLLGRREALASGLALFGLASLAGGVAQDEVMLVAARAGQGLGAAVVGPAGLSIITTSFAAGAERNRALAWWGTLGGLGGATGALVGGLLTVTLSWRWVMLVNAPLCLGAALAALRVVPALDTPRRRSLDLAGALTVSGGLVAVALAIVGAERHGPGSAAAVTAGAAGAALLGLFLVIEARVAAAPLIPLGIFRSRGLSGASAVLLCLGAVTFSMWFLYTLYLQRVLGLSPWEAGVAFAPVSLTIVAATRLGGRLSTAFGPGRVATAGMAVLSVGMLAFAHAGPDASWAPDLLVPSLLCAAGIGCSFVPATIAATSAVAGEDAGLASGVLNTAYQVGSSLGLALVAGLSAGGFSRAFAVAGVLALVGAAVALTVLASGTRGPAAQHARERSEKHTLQLPSAARPAGDMRREPRPDTFV
jgi:EmrB/QacA subfamily drug resistance transporter